MKRLLCTTSIVFTLLFLVALALPFEASGSGTVKAYTYQTEVITGEEIVWYVGPSDFAEPFECAFFLYRDAVLIAYEPPSSAAVYRYTPLEAGTYQLVVLARNSMGVCTASGGSVTAGEPLRIESITANRPRIPLGAAAAWTACVQGGSGNAKIVFFVYRDGALLELCVPDDVKSGILNYTPDVPGTYTVDVLASDASGKAKMAGAPIIVTDEGQKAQPLQLTSVFANAPDVYVGDEIVWTATASGGEEAIAFSFFLYKDGEVVSFTPVGTSSVFRFKPTEPGIYAVSAHAGSGLESANLMSGNVTVKSPAGIVLSGVACDKCKAVLGETLTFTAQAEDASGEIIYSFALYRDFKLMGLYDTGTSPVFSFTPGDTGIYSVIAYAKDDVQSSSVHSLDVRVVPQALTVDSVTADQLTGSLNRPVTWTVHATGGDNLQYMYFVYFMDQVIYASPATAQNTFTYTPTEYKGNTPYILRGLVSDGQQTASFQSAWFSVAMEGRSRILSVVPDRMTASPGEEITWTVKVDNGNQAGNPPVRLLYILFRGEDVYGAADEKDWGTETVYSFVPKEPGSYLLTVFISAGDGNNYQADAPVVRVVSPMLVDIDIAIDPDRFSGISLPNSTPVPTMPIPELVVPNVNFPNVLATKRPPMAPSKPTPSPTLIPVHPGLMKPHLQVP